MFKLKVESTYGTMMDSFKELLILKKEISQLIPSKSSLPEILLRNINIRFSDTCDYLMAELSYLLTTEGRDWWKKKKIKK